jgi:hypothetical protein
MKATRPSIIEWHVTATRRLAIAHEDGLSYAIALEGARDGTNSRDANAWTVASCRCFDDPDGEAFRFAYSVVTGFPAPPPWSEPSHPIARACLKYLYDEAIRQAKETE